MDPLSDVLALLKPQSTVSAGFNAGGDWAIAVEDSIGWIKCYAVTSGGCWLAVEGVAGPVRLVSGDCFVLASGRPFRLASDLAVASVDAATAYSAPRRNGVITHNGGGDVFLVGSRFSVDGRQAEALLRTLPPIIHLEATSDQAALRWSIERMMEERQQDRPGAELVMQHLAHLVLVQALRLHLSRQTKDQAGWFSALSDPRISTAMGAMHADPAHRWTLGELAGQAGMSRSVFAQRFRTKVGQTPIEYLTRWRMMLAGDRLTHTNDQLAQTALSLGYESESAFSNAFKRVMGCSPRRYARGTARG
jgi:AraC-like DNA-binding protein